MTAPRQRLPTPTPDTDLLPQTQNSLPFPICGMRSGSRSFERSAKPMASKSRRPHCSGSRRANSRTDSAGTRSSGPFTPSVSPSLPRSHVPEIRGGFTWPPASGVAVPYGPHPGSRANRPFCRFRRECWKRHRLRPAHLSHLNRQKTKCNKPSERLRFPRGAAARRLPLLELTALRRDISHKEPT